MKPSVFIVVFTGAALFVSAAGFASADSFVPLDALQAVPKNTTDASSVLATIFLR